jgi:hypothetical protein
MKWIPSAREGLAIALIPLVVFGFLVGTGNVTTGPRLTDDNQIYRLQIELAESGFLQVFVDDVSSRIGMKRLVPIHCLHKVAQAALLGGDLVLWSLWVGALAALGGILLFVFCRLCDFSVFESLAFALLTIVGEQSVTWWRLFHGEGIGMVLVAGSMICMALRVRTGRRAFELPFVALLVLAILVKESFILAAPAILLWKVWLTRVFTGASVVSAFRQSLASIVTVAVVSVAAVAIILFVFPSTDFGYAGWTGFRMDWIVRILRQYAWISDAWLLPVLLIVLLVARRIFPRAQEEDAPAEAAPPPGSGVFVALIWVSLTVPQLLLNMQSGLSGGHEYARYVLPAILGMALLVVLLLRRIRRELGAGSPVHVASIVLVSFVFLLDGRVAWLSGQKYARVSRRNDTLLDTIGARVDPADPVVLAFSNSNLNQITGVMRVYYILRERHGFEEIYFLPVPGSPSMRDRILHPALREDTRRHARDMRHPDQVAQKGRIGAVLIVHHGMPKKTEQVEESLHERVRWFVPDAWERQGHPDGHVTFFRRSSPPE